AAAKALAGVVADELTPQKVIPSPFDERVAPAAPVGGPVVGSLPDGLILVRNPVRGAGFHTGARRQRGGGHRR
ncbi:hypothetical protein, partial [Kitasatospora sp. NPDC047058]|uniref:hypothetical protein n=1 Tax=Kitasatospora sp. NPDC047058 TaxID=3155620 RepID=UPI0033E923F0